MVKRKCKKSMLHKRGLKRQSVFNDRLFFILSFEVLHGLKTNKKLNCY
ncbi:MAG: hypothetical protein ACTSWG_10585 [Candidatus Helarchaeota archaeon]